DSRKSSFGDKKKPFGYTNNPKYFNKSSDQTSEGSDKKNSFFKGKKKFKNTINNLNRCGFDIFIKNIQNIIYLSFLEKSLIR
ncbi:hypothetical protein, partial [Desulfobacula sp.]|uniref:hypothetical protein n=1 Tax=Desulfobacula sp. TaxID=2593537 RepID=UPI0039B89229